MTREPTCEPFRIVEIMLDDIFIVKWIGLENPGSELGSNLIFELIDSKTIIKGRAYIKQRESL